MKRPLWLLIAVAAAALNVTGTAQASYPGTNGRIAFVRDVCDPNTCVDQIYTVNSDGSNLVNVSGSATISVWAPRWTPGGKILFDRSTGGLDQVFQMNGDGTGVTQISNGSFNDDQPSPSPAAVGKIAFVHAQNIWTMSNTGTNRTQLSTDALDDTSPVWSPNGANIAYGRYFYNGSNYVTQVVRIPASGGTATIVAQFTSCCGVGGLDWSPDGTTVAFSFEGNLYTAPADGSGTPVEQRDNVYNASYSPDKSMFALDSAGEIYTQAVGGGTSIDVATGDDPSWGSFTCTGSGCGGGGGSSGGTPGTISAQFITPSSMTTAATPTVPYNVSWVAGTCPSGSTYTLAESTNGRSPTTVFTGGVLSTTVNLPTGNTYTLSVDCGGPSSSTSFALGGVQETAATYTGTWTSNSFTGAWGGTVKYSTLKNASASYTCTSCEAIAWVTDEDSNHGSAKVYIDGSLQTTVSTHSTTSKNRLVVYKFGWAADGEHTIKIVNAGTKKTSRVTIDGFLTRS